MEDCCNAKEEAPQTSVKFNLRAIGGSKLADLAITAEREIPQGHGQSDEMAEIRRRLRELDDTREKLRFASKEVERLEAAVHVLNNHVFNLRHKFAAEVHKEVCREFPTYYPPPPPCDSYCAAPPPPYTIGSPPSCGPDPQAQAM